MGRVCWRVRETVPGASNSTLVFIVGDKEEGNKVHQVGSEEIVRMIRTSCRVFGDKKGYRMKPNKIGSTSI